MLTYLLTYFTSFQSYAGSLSNLVWKCVSGVVRTPSGVVVALSVILAPSTNVTTYLLTYLLSVDVTQGEDGDDDDDSAERQSMYGLIVEHAYTVNAATTVSRSLTAVSPA